MTTEQEIQQIAERLRTLCNNDNDAPRLIKEYLGDFFDINELENTIIDLEYELDNATKELEKLQEKVEELEEANEELLDEIQALKEDA